MALSFDGLIEARAVKHLLAQGISKRKLSAVCAAMRKRFNEAHPLAHERSLITDGAALLECEADNKFVDLLSETYVMPDIIRPSLHGKVEFRSGRAAWLEPFPMDLPLVRIDPSRAFGRPVIVEGNVAVPTATLNDAATNEGIVGAADWFGVSGEAVRQAVGYERRLSA